MIGTDTAGPGSTLLLEEYFDRQDARFPEELRRIRNPGALAGLARRWIEDPRPWAREMLTRYLEEPLATPGHHPLVKALFKIAESGRDTEVMGLFLRALDRSVRRKRRTRWRWDFSTRQSFSEEILWSPRDSLLADRTRKGKTRQRVVTGRTYRLFSLHTRYYLRRRVWRFFRRLGFSKPAGYVTAVATALRRYEDEDLVTGENILDCRGLVHALFGRHPALDIKPWKIDLKEGAALRDLSPAPRFPEAWARGESLGDLLQMAGQARSRLVRIWAIRMAKEGHSERLEETSLAEVRFLLDHTDPEVQVFGGEVFAGLKGLEKLPLETWLELLEVRNLDALEQISKAMARHVAPGRFSLEQVVELATRAPAPVARCGLDLLRGRDLALLEERRLLSGLCHARSRALAGEITTFALGQLGRPDTYDRDLVIGFLDSILPETRGAAWEWLMADSSPGHKDPLLWSRLVETPHDDIRLPMIDHLERLSRLPGVTGGHMVPVWSTVLLGIHRGGRQKVRAVDQVTRAITEDPSLADRLLGVLVAALRSVRKPEFNRGLSALVRLAALSPELHEKVRRAVPELDPGPQGGIV